MKQLFLAAMAASLLAGAVPALAAEGVPGSTVRPDGSKDQADRQARREQWCKDNPERCGQMKARMEERRKQCEANPAECRPTGRPAGKT
jgi:hypothetical protein